MARIQWFTCREDFTAAARCLSEAIARHDVPLASLESVDGYCQACGCATVFLVNTGAMFAERPNLREGLRCTRCQLTARQRLVLLAMQGELETMSGKSRAALLERTTRLYGAARRRWPGLVGSEYLGEHRTSGRYYWWSTHWWRWRRTRHESITGLSYADQSLDLLVHSDVLEHVYNTRRALAESVRVLREKGVMIFTAPFFVEREVSLLRGRPLDGGVIEHLEAPEYHGDGVARGGIYTFHSFGWDLIPLMYEAGFARVEIGLCHASDEGFAVADPGIEHAWTGLLTVFRATR